MYLQTYLRQIILLSVPDLSKQPVPLHLLWHYLNQPLHHIQTAKHTLLLYTYCALKVILKKLYLPKTKNFYSTFSQTIPISIKKVLQS